MLRKTKDLKRFKLGARDGDIGHIKEFYFDDQKWTVRYLVADTGHWLTHRKVLISPFAITGVHSTPHNAVDVNLTKKQIEESPPIETHKPVSRQYEEKYSQYYGWPYYWPGPLLWGPVPYPGLYLPEAPPAQPPADQKTPGEDSHLRSTSEVTGYEIQALNDHFGHVEEFMIDDRAWRIRYLVIDTRKWLPGKKVLLSPNWISSVSWPEAKVYIDLDRETVQRSPEYDADKDITREYEEQLFEHYNREPYWRSKPEFSTSS
jgi:hypothetical protein